MSAEAPKQPTVQPEAVDDSWVKLAEGGFEAAKPEIPEAPETKQELPAAETPEAHEAAINDVRERLAANAAPKSEEAQQAEHYERLSGMNTKEERRAYVEKLPLEQIEKIRPVLARLKQERESRFPNTPEASAPQVESPSQKLFETIAANTGKTWKGWAKNREDYKNKMLAQDNGDIGRATRRMLSDEEGADNHRRKTALYTGIGTAAVGMAGMMGTVLAGANEALAALGGATLPELGLGVGVAGIALGAAGYAGLSIWNGIKRARHRSAFKKIYGREP